jgi:hypothetical protein
MKPIQWKLHIHPINLIFATLSLWRGERWLKHFWSIIQHNSKINYYSYKLSYYLKNCVYLIFNPKTKKVIIGSTSSTIYSRFKQHLAGKTDNLSKQAAHYIQNLGIEQWIIIPLEHLHNSTQQTRYIAEGKWARLFKNYLIDRKSVV